jgi:hypothetical protein
VSGIVLLALTHPWWWLLLVLLVLWVGESKMSVLAITKKAHLLFIKNKHACYHQNHLEALADPQNYMSIREGLSSHYQTWLAISCLPGA